MGRLVRRLAGRDAAGRRQSRRWCRPRRFARFSTANVVKSSALVITRLAKFYHQSTAHLVADKDPGVFRATHLHGRALNGLSPRAVEGIAAYRIRDSETVAGQLIGWNFGEGLHNEQLLTAVQCCCRFTDGDLWVIVLEGQPIHRGEQAYRIVDAQSGLIEARYVAVADMLGRQR